MHKAELLLSSTGPSMPAHVSFLNRNVNFSKARFNSEAYFIIIFYHINTVIYLLFFNALYTFLTLEHYIARGFSPKVFTGFSK